MGRIPERRLQTSDDRMRQAYELFRSRGLRIQPPELEKFENKEKTEYTRRVSCEYIKDDLEFQRHASENQWSERTARGIPSRACIFQFLRDTYEPWLGQMNQADLRAVDLGAWRALQNRLQKEKMPDWLLLPKLSDRYLPKEGTPEYEAVLEARRQNRERMRLLRSLHPF